MRHVGSVGNLRVGETQNDGAGDAAFPFGQFRQQASVGPTSLRRLAGDGVHKVSDGCLGQNRFPCSDIVHRLHHRAR